MKKTLLFFLTFFLVSWNASAADPKGLSYKDALKKYHRHGEFFNRKNLHAHIFWDVVYKDMEFREAAARAYAKHYRLSDAELAEMIREERVKVSQGEEFIVVLYTYHKKWNDLEKENSIWRLRLETTGQTYEPTSILKIKPSAIDEFMYPYMRPWTQMYSILFPPGAAGSGDFALSLFGVLGNQSLKWEPPR